MGCIVKILWASLIGIIAVGAAQPNVLASDTSQPSTSVQTFVRSQGGYRSSLLLLPSVTFFQVSTGNQGENLTAVFSIEKLQPIANTFGIQTNSSLTVPFLPPELIDAFAVNAKPSSPQTNPIGFFQVPPLDFNAKVRIGRD